MTDKEKIISQIHRLETHGQWDEAEKLLDKLDQERACNAQYK